MNYKTFETARLFLRPALPLEDAAFVLELMNTPKWKQNIGDRNLNSLEDATHYINTRMMPQLERLGYGNYVLLRKSDNAKIGSCGLYDRVGLEGIDIGFAFLPAYERKGYAFEAAHKILDAGTNVFNIKKISAITIKENINSQKLLEKLGLKFIKLIRIANDEEELMYYELP
jgi:ribosomal-protein-alanine N-acetyltransferase